MPCVCSGRGRLNSAGWLVCHTGHVVASPDARPVTELFEARRLCECRSSVYMRRQPRVARARGCNLGMWTRARVYVQLECAASCFHHRVRNIVLPPLWTARGKRSFSLTRRPSFGLSSQADQRCPRGPALPKGVTIRARSRSARSAGLRRRYATPTPRSPLDVGDRYGIPVEV